MTGFRVLPIPATVTDVVRSTLKSPQYGHPAHVELASGYGPCRSCLRQFRTGTEQRILFTYNPFEGVDEYPSPGPIFIHAEPCASFSALSEFPEELRALPLTLEAYGKDRWIVSRERPQAEEVESSIEKLLSTRGVEYIHIRNTEAGCFIARIERRLE
jgi:hypothetical protein